MANKKLVFIRIISFAISLIIMVFIFSMSSQDAQTSSSTSGGFIESIIRFLDKDFEQLSDIEREEYVGQFQFVVRKLAHFSVYFALGLTLSSGMQTFIKLKVLTRAALAFLVGVLYAISDEIHQTFVPGRSCELRDVLIDTTGVLLGCLFIMLLIFLFKNRKKVV